MKKLFTTLLHGATLAFGTLLGMEAFNKLKNPVVRTKIKKKFTDIKNTLFKKEEES